MGEATGRLPRGDRGPGIGRGWARRDTRTRLAPTYRADPEAVAAAAPGLEDGMVERAKVRAQMIAAASFELYREIALSALSLVRR